jgi:hypothetical protein
MNLTNTIRKNYFSWAWLDRLLIPVPWMSEIERIMIWGQSGKKVRKTTFQWVMLHNLSYVGSIKWEDLVWGWPGQKVETLPEKVTKAKRAEGTYMAEVVKWWSICLASLKPWVQTPTQKKKNKENLNGSLQTKKGSLMNYITQLRKK